MTTHSSILKRAAELIDRDEVDVEIGALETKAAEVRSAADAQIAEIERERDAELAEIRRELDTLAALKLYVVGVGPIGTEVSASAIEHVVAKQDRQDPTPDPARPRARKGAKQEAVLDLLQDGTMRSKNSIGHYLIDRGLMTDAKKDWHSLDVLLSRMVAQTKKIARPRPSMYQSLSAASAADDGNSRLPVQEVEG